jgi:hypothetical protein
VIPGEPTVLAALAVPDGPSGTCGCAPASCVAGLGSGPSVAGVDCTASAREGCVRIVEGSSGLSRCSVTIAVAWLDAGVAATSRACARAGVTDRVAWTGSGLSGSVAGAAGASATAAAGGVSAGFATTSTTGLGSGVAVVAGVAFAG